MAGHFEAKKHAYRQTQDGVVISFVIHPNDVAPDLATAALGTRYMLGFAEIGDDGKPIELKSGEATAYDPERVSNPGANVVSASKTAIAGQVKFQAPATSSKDRRPFASLPLSQQAALRCQDDAFLLFLAVSDSEAAAKKVRTLCGVSSRSELNDLKNMGARETWFSILDDYDAFLTDRQYAEVRR